jgi:hypothetical protein
MKTNEVHALRELGKITTQWCRHCKTDKPTTRFYACHRTKCIDCRVKEKKDRLSNTERDFCHTCSTWKSVRDFDINDKGVRMSRCSRCTRIQNEKPKKEKIELVHYIPEIERWSLHVGTVHLFIVGPGEFSMVVCSEPYYRGTIGNDEERSIAKMAISFLNKNHPYAPLDGLETIHKALREAEKIHNRNKIQA